MLDLKPYINQINFGLKLYYYRFLDPYQINHYNLINKLDKYKSISTTYFNKYPSSSNWGNLNDKLFENPSIKQEFVSCVKVQSQIKTQVLHDIQVLCNENKNSDLCSEQFQTFYVQTNYHIEQNIDDVIDRVKSDVMNILLEKV
jgi:hypothetical protein